VNGRRSKNMKNKKKINPYFFLGDLEGTPKEL